jgi:hypothetical protein
VNTKLGEALSVIREEGGDDSVLIMKAINSYIVRQEWEAEKYWKSKEIEAELQEELTCRFEYMKASAESLKEPLDKGSTFGVADTYRELVLKLERFKEGMQNTLAREPVGTHPDGNWMRQVDYICRDALVRTVIFLGEEADQEGDPLKPLRSALDRVGGLAQLVGGFKLEPSKMEPRDISKGLAIFNRAIFREAHELVEEAGDIITCGQRRIRKLLQRLGVQGGAKMSSIETPADGAQGPCLERLGKGRNFLSGGDLVRTAGGTGERTRGRARKGEEPPARGPGGLTHEENDLAALLPKLGGAQAKRQSSKGSMWSTPSLRRSGGPKREPTTTTAGTSWYVAP